MSPYVFVANSPTNLIDPDGLEPIDPRTGKPVKINLYKAAVYDDNYNDFAKLNVIKDYDLYDNADPFIERSRNSPSGHNEGAAYNIHESNFSHTTIEAKAALGKLFPSNKQPGSAYSAPNDEVWRKVAEKGTYTYLDDRYSESEWLHINTTSFNIMTVEQNYITQIVNLTRPDGDGSFNIKSVTTFDIQKSDVQSREVDTWWGGTKTEKYKTLTVTETTQSYKNNQASGAATSKTYTKDEIIK
jgi:hypothetical protein